MGGGSPAPESPPPHFSATETETDWDGWDREFRNRTSAETDNQLKTQP